MAGKLSREEFQRQFLEQSDRFERLRTTAYGMIRNALNEGGVEHLPLQSRVKDSESAFRKSHQKGYSDPFSEITDFIGIRIIVLLERDIDRVSGIIRNLFEIDAVNSVDKRQPDQVDTVGYRSLHLICKLGNRRKVLPEYSSLSEISFEIQVRTALQHTWAEIEHKRRYKGKFSLPNELQHRLMVISGTLELIDREFSAIAIEADDYSEKITRDAEHDSDSDELSGVAATAIYSRYISQYPAPVSDPASFPKSVEEALEELFEFGIRTVADLRAIVEEIPSGLAAAATKHSLTLTPLLLFRTAMMSADLSRFLQIMKAKKNTLLFIDEIQFFGAALSEPHMTEIFDRHGVEYVPF